MKLLAIVACTVLLAAAAPPGTNLILASSLIASGGGPGSFSAVRAFDAMIGQDAVFANQQQLVTTFGESNANGFMDMFDYAIADAWQLAGKDNISIPAPTQTGGVALATELVQAGGGKTFDTNTLFAVLFGSKITNQVEADVNAKYGPGSWTNFSRMSDQFFHNIGQKAGMNG